MTDHVIGVLGLAAGLPGLLEVCLHLGAVLGTKLDLLRTFEVDISDYALKFALHWDTQKSDLERLQQMQSWIAEDVKDRLAMVLEKLRKILDEALSIMSKYLPAKPASSDDLNLVKRLRYALFEERTMAQLDSELRSWGKRFSKRLVCLAATEETKVRQSSVTMKCQTKTSLRIPMLLPNSDSESETWRRPDDEISEDNLKPLWQFGFDRNEGSLFSSDTHPGRIFELYESSFSESPLEEVENLTAKLCSAKPQLMHILQCEGYSACHTTPVNSNDGLKYLLHFVAPPRNEGKDPLLLRECLAYEAKHPLNDRLRIAIELATAVWYIHSGDIVHKAIRPENILVFHTEDKGGPDCRMPYRLGSAFLNGFVRFRRIASGTLEIRNTHDVENLYAHPRRWDVQSIDRFSPYHDIYSLGIVLLELGLWHSFLIRTSSQNDWEIRRPMAEYLRLNEGASEKVKDLLVKTATKNLPRVMGNDYAEVVIACLTCLEGGLTTKISPYSGASHNISLAYLESVLDKLERIQI